MRGRRSAPSALLLTMLAAAGCSRAYQPPSATPAPVQTMSARDGAGGLAFMDRSPLATERQRDIATASPTTDR